MKKSFKYIFGLLLIGSALSCKDDLNINNNPNQVTNATVQQVLPNAIVSTADLIRQYNTYGAQTVGYFANSGGVSGWGAIISYNYQTSDWAALWDNTYNTLSDIQYVIDNTQAAGTVKEFNAAAKVLKAYNFMLLVDTYNDVPYTEALTNGRILKPKYDKAQDIYRALAVLCDEAMATFNGITTVDQVFNISSDPLFNGKKDKWIQFANTIKLKLIVKGAGKVTFDNSTFDPIGFIAEDAIVNPGYTKIENKQNPMWNTWSYSAAGAVRGFGSQYAPTPWIMSFYGTAAAKIQDPARANVVYKSGTATALNQLGYQASDAGRGATPNSWFRGTNADNYEKIGIIKGVDAGQPIMLAAESYFLQAEALLNGSITSASTVQQLFEAGIKASFTYLFKDNTNIVPATRDVNTVVNTYLTNNAANALVDYAEAVTTNRQLEAIITQKYIAFNMLFGHEAWNEYRRTGFPRITGNTATTTFASMTSESTAPDKLPTRILYPVSEYKFNASNIPTVDKYTSKIFWAK